MSDFFDVLVVGSGHNGLVAGAYLAKGGMKVLVIEKNANLGGGVVTSELVAPGFRHDWHSATHIVIQANPLIRADELGLISKFGLEYIYPEGVFSTIFDDGSSIVTYGDVDRTCESIALVSPRDAEAYRAFVARSQSLLPMMVHGMFVPPPPQGAFFALLDQSAEGRALMHIMQKSMLDVVNEYFESDRLKVHLLKFAAEMLVGPDEKGTGAFIFNMPGFVHTYHPGIPRGGSGALVSALEKCLLHHGAHFQTGAEVVEVIVRDGRAVGVRLANGETIEARRAVIGQIHPWLLGDMVPTLDPDVAARARATKTASLAISAVMYALKEPPRYLADEAAGKVALVNFAPASLEAYLRIFDDMRHGDLPKSPILAAHDNAQWDASRAPSGGATLTVYGFGPFDLRDGGSAAWDDSRPELQRYIHEMFGRFCANMNDENIIGVEFHSPTDMARYSPTFQRGDVGGVGKFLFQSGGHRPTPDLAQYAVPGADGLYLAGTFMHPPGGVTGGGRATAIRICGDMGIDFDSIREAS
ncbi:MAG TPA: NAD(P)/FAD-dependent oxidoreductase [Sphingobium sp.]